MERLTKLAITLWAGAAIALQVWILHYSWRELPLLTLVAVLGMALVAFFERRSVAIVMVLAYVFPVLVRYMRGFHSSFYSVLWLAALLGVMLPDIVRTPWHLRRQWRMPLVFSVFVVAVSAVIVLVREMDGVPLLLLDTEAAYATRGFLPTFTARWVLSEIGRASCRERV